MLSGDEQSGTDKLLLSGDMHDDGILWHTVLVVDDNSGAWTQDETRVYS